MCKGSWSYAANKIITDTGCGYIQLSGAVVEVMGVRNAMTIRVTTPTTATNGGTIKAQFTYINHGDNYAPGWRRDFNRDGDSMTGLLTLANISQPLRTPGGGILANDGNLYIKKAGFEGWIDGLFLKLTGGTLTGSLGFQNSNGKVFRVQTTETPSLNTYMQIWGSSSRPTVIELKDEKGYHFYSQRNTDNSITMRVNGEVVSGAANAFRAVYGNYGFFIRNDGTTTYFLLTNSGDQLGGWGPLRPLYFSNTTGRVTLGNGVDINNGAVINGGVGLGVTNALGGNSIVLGDNDTGFKQNGDGILDVYANSQHVFRFQPGALQSNKPINVTGRVTPTDYGNFDGRYQLKNTASKAANGWHKDAATGVITQWGTAPGGNDDKYYSVTLPIAFPSAFVSLQVYPIYASAVTSGHTLTSAGKINSKSQFSYGVSDGSSGSISASGVYWTAIGY